MIVTVSLGPQILVTDFVSRFLTSVVAICLSLATPYLFKILKAFVCWALRPSGSARRQNDHDGEQNPLLNDSVTHYDGEPNHNNGLDSESSGTAESRETSAVVLYHAGTDDRSDASESAQTRIDPQTISGTRQTRRKTILGILKHSGSNREFAWECLKYISQLDRWSSVIGLACLVLFLFFVVFAAWTLLGILSANIASDQTGLSSSERCGIWQFDDKAGDEAAYRDDLYSRQKEERASQYAQNCYNNPDLTDTLSCKVFYNQSIAFETKTRQICPFSSPELCHTGLYGAISFDTGLVDASTVGINDNPTYKFRRTTSCSPLNMSEPYITKRHEEVDDSEYYYNYGSINGADYMFNTSGNPFEWLVPVYTASAEFSSLYPDQDYWHPVAGLTQTPGSTTTIIFVTSAHIFHIAPSYDAIFPAEERRSFQGSYEDYYYNSDPRARPIACVDTSQVCSADGKKCWGMRDTVPSDMYSSHSFWLMKWSLESSTIYDSMGWRLGAAFLVQQKVSQYISTPLPSNQWEIEASQLFATSLARIQYDAWGIATGIDRKRPGYVEVTPDEGRGHLCGLYKFKTADYTNVNLLAFIGWILLSVIIHFLSWEVNLTPTGETAPQRRLVIGVLLSNPRLFGKAIGTGFLDLYGSCKRRWIHDRRTLSSAYSQNGDTAQ